MRDFETALREGRSGIRSHSRMRELNLHCQVAGEPEVSEARLAKTFNALTLRTINSGMLYAGLAAIECWRDAGFAYDPCIPGPVDWMTGAVVGTGLGGVDTISEKLVSMINLGMARRMGSALVEQFMSSAVSAFVGGLLGLGGEVNTISSACATGTEALVQAVRCLKMGQACRMMAGSAEGASVHAWAAFDAMRVCCRAFNDEPERASRPLSKTAGGFVPSAGAGMLMLETLDSAQSRGARIYAEIVGTGATCGGQRNGGSITSGNPSGMRRCIQNALSSAHLEGADIDYINGHLTATIADTKEVENIKAALDLPEDLFPLLNSTKSMIGHSLGASGSIESVATVLQLDRGFIHPSLNTEDLHPSVEWLRPRIPQTCIASPISTAMKVSFGFGDVNACVILRKWGCKTSAAC
nr:beta-ketoacyl-[acyl-carrier-protein] synthase family protein [Acidisarcina polymorpha]